MSTGARITLKTLVIAAGEFSTLTMKVKTDNRVGPQRFSCVLVFDDGTRRVCEAVTEFLRRVRLDVEHIDLGILDPNVEAVRNVEVSLSAPPGRSSPSLSAVEIGDSEVVTEVQAASPLPKDESGVRRITQRPVIRVKPDPASSRPNHVVVIPYQCEGVDRSIQIPVQWQLKAENDVQPARLFLGRIVIGNSIIVWEVTVARTDGRRFQPESAADRRGDVV